MTLAVKDFVERYIDKIENSEIQYVLYQALDELPRDQQSELVNILETIGIAIQEEREIVLEFFTNIELGSQPAPILLKKLINRRLVGLLGFTAEEYLNYILSHRDEWGCILLKNADEEWVVYSSIPRRIS